MKNKRTEKNTGRSLRKLLAFGLLAALTGIASVAGATYSLPASRSVAWQGNVGVLNDIASRTTIYQTLSPSGGDDTSAIQTAINGCPSGQVVSLSAGTFNISGNILMKSGVTLRGAGMGTTILHGTGTSSSYLIGFQASGFSWDLSANPSIAITGGLSQGSTTITTSSAHGWSPGDVILIDQLNNPSGNPVVTNVGEEGTASWVGRANGSRALGQMVKIATVPTATSATLEVPLYWNYSTSLSPQGVKVPGLVSSAGVENLTVDNSSSGNGNQGTYGTIGMIAASNCWLYQVEGIGTYVSLVDLFQGYRNTIRSCKFHEGVPATPTNGSQYGPSRGYGIRLNPWASANLIENNQVYHVAVGILLDGCISGNVISYNYITGLYYPDTSWEREAISFHGAHPMMNLFEGNYVDQWLVAADNIWGSSSHSTFFRNRGAIDTSKTNGLFNVFIGAHQQYYSLIGNVIGTAGFETIYEESSSSFSVSGPGIIYALGYWNATNGSYDSNFDPAVKTSTLRHGNWDSANNSVIWNGTDDQTLPASMYLTSKPGWWNSTPWPAIGPDVSPMYPSRPTLGAGTPWGGSGSASSSPAPSPTLLAAPTNLRIQ